MENKKREVISAAWLKFGVPYGKYIDDEGFALVKNAPDFLDDFISGVVWKSKHKGEFEIQKGKIRPLSLKGIENNNGWIGIESKEDLPSEDGEYYVIRKFHSDIIRMQSYGNIKEMENVSKSWVWNYTHYQPILKPLPPIY